MDSRSPFACLLVGHPRFDERSNSESSPPSTNASRCARARADDRSRDRRLRHKPHHPRPDAATRSSPTTPPP
jgi:hypothetical protein